jgi:hypothetical protein
MARARATENFFETLRAWTRAPLDLVPDLRFLGHERRPSASGRGGGVSGPKTKCPSCGTEWDGPVVFCGECGARFGAPEGKNRGLKTTGNLGGGPRQNKPAPPFKPIAQTVPMGRGNPPGNPTLPSMEKQRPPPPIKKGKRGSDVDLGQAIDLPDGSPLSDPKPVVVVAGQLGASAPPAAQAAPPSPPVEPAAVQVAPVPEAPPPPPPPAPPPPAPGTPPVRPTLASAPAITVTSASVRPAPADDDTARLLEDLDAGFESIVRPTGPVAPAVATSGATSVHPAPIPRVDEAPPERPEVREARHQADMAEVRELFSGLAVAYARPMRDFMLEVAWGDPTREWIEVALPATQSLRRAASAVELPGVDAALEGFQTALELAMGEPSIGTEVREMLAGAYARLVDTMPNVFALEGERVRREPIIVRSLLLQVPGVRHVALEKLYRAGIYGLDALYAARPGDLAAATGLDEAIATAIYERFQRYRREVAELGPGRDRAKERAELTGLVDDLARLQKEHEAAATSWAPDAAQRRIRARKDRDAMVVQIDLLLARLGEIELQRSISKVPFQNKIRELYRFLDEANQRSGR